MIIYFSTKTTNAIRSWCRRNGLNCGCGLGEKMEKSFAYSFENHRIILPNVYITNELDDYFMDYLKDKGVNINVDILALTILHEIGHSETVKLFNDKEQERNLIAKMEIEANITNDNLKQSNYKYWDLPIEYSANTWAINYATMFPQKVEKLKNIIYNNCIIIKDE